MTIPDRWNLLRVSPCRACGRPVAEGCACGWCGDTETRPIPALEPEITIGDPDTGIELQLQ